ncbi:MAG: AraC family transcriptional regulator [Flavobacteriaceae bacterium]
MKPILEPILLGQQKTIIGFSYDKPNFEMPWHFHPQHELTYIEESVGTKFVGDFVGPYKPGELVLLRSNLPHCWKNQLQSTGRSRSIVIQWNKGVFPNVPELKSVFELLKTASRGILFNSAETSSILKALVNFPQLDRQDMYVELLRILVRLSKCSYRTLSKASFTDDIPSEYGNRMTKIYNYVEANYDRKIYLKELSQITNLSEQSFSRFFTKMMGRPFFTFLNEYRINMAARMLLDTDSSVSQIGFASGYDSLPFFYRQFNKFMGCTPLSYQQKHASTYVDQGHEV